MANIATIKPRDIANGPGVRVSVFISGCTHHCKGCFNPETWDFDYGQPFTYQVMLDILDNAKPDYISGITLLGGDPLCGKDNQYLSHAICHIFKSVYPDKDIWLYTGYQFEEIKDLPVMKHVDVLVDGPFIEEKKNLMLKFRGSENQRLIDVKETRKQGKIVLLNM